MAMEQAALIYNPQAGALQRGAAQIARLVAALRARGVEAAPRATAARGDATKLAQRAVAEGCCMLIVCGGDGTINEAAQALVGSQTALAIWPCGTANVLAKDLRLPRRIPQAAELIASGAQRVISAGRAFKLESDWQRHFLLMAGIGLDAAIIQRVDVELKRRTGFGAYWAASLSFLARWQLTPFQVMIEGQNHEAAFAVIANAPSYAAWFTLAPQARLEDDQLDVCLFNSRRRLDYLGYAWLSLTGRHTRCDKVLYQAAREAAASADGSVPVQLDGELAGSLPMRFEVVPRALRVVAPGGR
jgi:diacylglycerol kinase (ATP)